MISPALGGSDIIRMSTDFSEYIYPLISDLQCIQQGMPSFGKFFYHAGNEVFTNHKTIPFGFGVLCVDASLLFPLGVFSAWMLKGQSCLGQRWQSPRRPHASLPPRPTTTITNQHHHQHQLPQQPQQQQQQLLLLLLLVQILLPKLILLPPRNPWHVPHGIPFPTFC